MKKMFLTAFAVFGMVAVNAQEGESQSDYGFSESDIFVEGNLNFTNTTDKTVNDIKKVNNSFSVMPKAGFFLNDKLAAGVEVGFGSTKNETVNSTNSNSINSSKATTSNFTAGLFARYYFLEVGERFKVHTEVGVAHTTVNGSNESVNGNTTTTTDEPKTGAFGVGVDLGLNYFVTEKIAISFGLADLLSFSSVKKDAAPGATTSPGATTNFNVNLNNLNNFFGGAQFGLLFKL